MPKNIEMNVLNESGSYDVLHPETQSDITLNSTFLKNLWSLEDNSSVDDAFNYLDRQLILIQYNKAGVNVTLTSAGGTPLEGFKINGITANYDGTGDCYTDSQGKCFGYCDAGSVTIGSNNFTDITFNSQQISAIATQTYNVNLIGTIASNFMKFTSSTNVIFSENVQQIDVTCVGGGGAAGGYSSLNSGESASGGAGGGGYCVTQENVIFIYGVQYSIEIGSGGQIQSGDGGTSSFLSISAAGGEGGGDSSYSSSGMTVGIGGSGNGNGGNGTYSNGYALSGKPGQTGTVEGYSSFTQTVVYGGGGGAGACSGTKPSVMSGGVGAGYGGIGGDIYKRGSSSFRANDGGDGENGFGGGGGSSAVAGKGDAGVSAGSWGKGGSGCVAIRLHYKVTS